VSKIPEWAEREAAGLWVSLGFVNDRLNHLPTIALALVAAEKRGIERAAAECDAVANDAGDKAARGFFTTEEQARRGAGRALAAAIRQLGEPHD